MVAGLFVLLIFLGFIAVMNVHQDVVSPAIQENLARQFAGQFRAYSHAALAFAESNQGYNGSIGDQQIAPYMGPWGFPSGAAAEMQGGLLDVWAMPPGLTVPQEEWVVKEMLDTGGDVAYAVNVNGRLISPVTGNMGSAPNGAPNGAAVYRVTAPHN
jgi:hypothetical protein